jgi:hypothetical protein
MDGLNPCRLIGRVGDGWVAQSTVPRSRLADLGAIVVTVNDLLGTGKYPNDRPDARKPTVTAADYIERLHWFACRRPVQLPRPDPRPINQTIDQSFAQDVACVREAARPRAGRQRGDSRAGGHAR